MRRSTGDSGCFAGNGWFTIYELRYPRSMLLVKSDRHEGSGVRWYLGGGGTVPLQGSPPRNPRTFGSVTGDVLP
jgi:hypothetical protein